MVKRLDVAAEQPCVGTRRAKSLDGVGDRYGDQRLPLGRVQQQFLFAIDDRACLEQDGGHPRLAEHDQLVIAVNSGLSIDELPLPIAHESFGVMRRVLQPARLELITQQLAKAQAAPEVPIVDGDKNRMALEAIAEGAFAAIVLRSKSPRRGGAVVISSTVLAKPAAVSLCSIRFARRRLNIYSVAPRALSTPCRSTVWPTSTTTRKEARSQLDRSDRTGVAPAVSADVPRSAVPASMVDRMMSAMVLARRGLFIKSPGVRVPHNEVGAAAYGSVFIMSMDFGVPLVLC